MIDAHCHLDLGDAAASLAAGRAAGVTGAVLAGVDPEGWARQAALVKAHPELHCTFGLHPWTVAAAHDDEVPGLLAALEGALDGGLGVVPVGLGELGLDHGRRGPKPTRARQEAVFRAQLRLARARGLPLVLHVVAAPGKALDVLAEEGGGWRGLVHRYSGPEELVGNYIDMGLHLSFGAELLYKPRLLAAIRRVPQERLLLETDAPDQLPDGAQVDLDALPRVLAAAAAARGEASDVLGAATAQNTRRLFGL